MNRLAQSAALAFVALLALGSPAQAQADVSGSWILTVESPEAGGDVTAVFEQDGETVTGALESPMVGGIEMSDGRIEGGKLTFLLHVDIEGQSYTVEVSAEVEGDSMKGSMYLPETGSMPFTGKRTDG